MGLTDMLLNRLKVQNPAGYNFIMEVKRSGRNPTDVLREMYQSGKINDAQLSQLQRQARMFGANISNQEIEKIKSIDVKPVATTTNKKFSGWF